jgi:hypothetical protein
MRGNDVHYALEIGRSAQSFGNKRLVSLAVREHCRQAS